MRVVTKIKDAIFYSKETNEPIFVLDDTAATLDCTFDISDEFGERIIKMYEGRLNNES